MLHRYFQKLQQIKSNIENFEILKNNRIFRKLRSAKQPSFGITSSMLQIGFSALIFHVIFGITPSTESHEQQF